MAVENPSKWPEAAEFPLGDPKNLALGSVSCPESGLGGAVVPTWVVCLKPVRYSETPQVMLIKKRHPLP